MTEEVKLKLDSKIVERRIQEVNDARDYLKYKYSKTIALYSDWQIWIVGVESRMNSLVKI